jgi:hypothetical protein
MNKQQQQTVDPQLKQKLQEHAEDIKNIGKRSIMSPQRANSKMNSRNNSA